MKLKLRNKRRFYLMIQILAKQDTTALMCPKLAKMNKKEKKVRQILQLILPIRILPRRPMQIHLKMTNPSKRKWKIHPSHRGPKWQNLL